MIIKIFALIIVILSLGCVSKKTIPILEVKEKDIDLGNIKLDSNYTLTYFLKNNGAADLVIDTITSSCGCTVPYLRKRVLASEDTFSLTVSYKPVDLGKFEKSLVIKSNAIKEFTILTFKGTIDK